MEDLPPGARIGDYRIECELGRGGMSVVYAATHLVIGKRAAIKVVRPILCADATGMLRAIQEARAINLVRHPNVVDVYAYGRLGDGRCYLIMEQLEGETLSERMGRRPISFDECTEILPPICAALEAAHANGIVHRDVKPANIFLTNDHRVKLLDFGLAKLVAEERGITQQGAVLGTPDYIAPEQARGGLVDSRADIYALGVVAFEMLSGQLPFSSEDAAVLLRRHAEEEAPSLREMSANVPPVMEALVAAMLRKDPAARPDASKVREVVLGVTVPPMAKPLRQQPGLWVAAAALLLIVSAGAAALASRAQRARPTALGTRDVVVASHAPPTPVRIQAPVVKSPRPPRVTKRPPARPRKRAHVMPAENELIDPFASE